MGERGRERAALNGRQDRRTAQRGEMSKTIKFKNRNRNGKRIEDYST
jgi:hypothetical protein